MHALPSLLSRLLEQLHWHGVLQVCVARDLGVGVLRMSGLFVWLKFWQCAWVMCMALVAVHVWQLAQHLRRHSGSIADGSGYNACVCASALSDMGVTVHSQGHAAKYQLMAKLSNNCICRGPTAASA